MIRVKAKLFAVTVIFTAFLHAVPLFAAPITWVSSTGSDQNPYPCMAAKPCATLAGAINLLDNAGQINCLDSPGFNLPLFFTSFSATIDCAGVWEPISGIVALTSAGNQIWKIRNLTISGVAGALSAIKVTGSGTLIIENCVFENLTGSALDIEPNGALNLVIKNSRISNNAAAILLKPASGGSVNATLDHVTIASNAGGGIRADSSNGLISADIVDSVISDNAANGLNISSGSGTQNDIVNITRSTIANNGLVGIQSGGSNAAVLLNASTLDSNTNGATDALTGARIVSYGNNQIIGAPGSGFTGSAALQ